MKRRRLLLVVFASLVMFTFSSQAQSLSGAEEAEGQSISEAAIPQTSFDALPGRVPYLGVPFQGLNTVPQIYPTDALLWDNGPYVTHPGGGSGGADASALQTALGMGTYGYGCQISAGNSVADDFTVTGTWTINAITFLGYQTNAGTATINDIRVQIYDGPPNAGGTVVWGNLTTNLFSAANFPNCYRVLDTDLTNTARKIYEIVAATPGLTLSAGTYWLEYQMGGSGSYTGPWTPPVTVLGSVGTGNALQYTTTGWAPVTDIGPQDFVFLIDGTSGSQPANDVGITAITSPVSGLNLGMEQVTVTVFNYGTNVQSNVPVYYMLDLGSPVYETVPGPVPSLGSVSYTFAAMVDLSAAGTYQVDVCTDMPGDENTANDCKMTTVTNIIMGNMVLLSPDRSGDRVSAFDPSTGVLLNAEFIPNGGFFSTPVEAILSHDGQSILISDQVLDVIQEFDLVGNFLGTFAPIGGQNPAIMDNIRGICLKPDGHLLVTVSGGTNDNSVVEFDTDGNYIGQFIAAGQTDPFDILYRPATNDYLVADIENPDHIKQFDANGNFVGIITSNVNFPEQLAIAANNNILAGCFSTPQGVHEYLPDGTLVGIYDVITGNRGAYELPDLTLLTTNSSGFHHIDRNNNLLGTIISGNYGYVNLIDLSGGAAALEVDLKVFLEGPYSGTTMGTSLNSLGFLPLAQPFNAAPWNYTGTEAVAAIPDVNIVDWLLIELRDAVDAASATSATMIAQQAVFVFNDGSVTAIDGTSNPTFNVTAANNLFVVVYHRNHLAVMSASPLAAAGNVYSWDYTTGAGQVYGGALGHTELVPGVWGMFGGDGNGDGQVGNTDKIDVWVMQAGAAGYLAGDFNMDGQVNNPDKVDVWAPNSGNGSQVP